MDYLINLIGFGNSVYIYLNMNKRKFFCVCDKITIGDRTPQCLLGALTHFLSLIFIFLNFGGYSFYPLSFWLFALFMSSIYTYKSIKEICKGCFISFTCAALGVTSSLLRLDSFPWIISSLYFSIFIFSIFLTSSSLKSKTN
jgi:hypothetical protein